MTGLRVALAGDEAAGVRTLGILQRSEHELVVVAANPSDDDRSLGARAAELGVTTIEARRLRSPETAEELAALEPDVLLNVHSLHKVHGEVLSVFGVGAWNLHPGPLPEAAGINVPNWAIAEGHTSHGVTVHAMTENYDEGSIAYEDRFPIKEGATGLTLSVECASRGLALVKRLCDQLETDPAGVPRIAQDLSRRRFFGIGQPNDGLVAWTDRAETVAAQVRAADFRPFDNPWQPPRAEVGGVTHLLREVAVGDETDASPGTVRHEDDELLVAAGDRWVRLLETEVFCQ